MTATPTFSTGDRGKLACKLVEHESSLVVLLDVVTPLSSDELDALSRCEQVISKAFISVFEMGRARIEIQQKRLYRAGFKTFEEYCRKRWDISRKHGYRQIQGAQVMANLSPMGDIPLPENERQARPMTGPPPNLVRKAWTRVVARSKTQKITERLVRAVVREIKDKTTEAEVRREHWQTLVEPLLKAGFKALRTGDREGVRDALNRAIVRLDVGNHGYSD